MRNLTREEVYSVSGALPSPGAGALAGAKVIWDAANGNAPGPNAFTGTASGPTPGGAGGRYPIEALGQEREHSNAPGGELGKSFSKFFSSFFGS